MSSLLAFDTATEHMSIALVVNGDVRVHEAAGGAQASTTLIPAIRRLLSDSEIMLRDLDAIGFGRGPGAFTGLRTACSVAQGLAFGVSKPVLCLDTLRVVAEDARRIADASDVWVVMDARMNEIYAARYVCGEPGGAWRCPSAPALYALDTLNALFAAQPPMAVAGTAVEAFGDRLLCGNAQRISGALPRAAAMAVIAEQSWLAGEAVDAALALPLYVREKVAMTTVERDLARAARVAAGA